MLWFDPTLHDLLQHYEEAHAEAQKSSQENTNTTEEPVMLDSRAAIATNTAASVQQEAQRQQQFSNFKPAQHRPSAFSSTLQTIPDMDTVEDMEMDDINSRGSRLTSAARLRRCGTSDSSAIRLSHHTKNVWLHELLRKKLWCRTVVPTSRATQT